MSSNATSDNIMQQQREQRVQTAFIVMVKLFFIVSSRYGPQLFHMMLRI